MSDEFRPRRGAHRTRPTGVAAVLPALLAVAVVVALIVALLWWRGEPVTESTPPDDVRVTTDATAGQTPSTTPSSSPAETPAETPAAEPTPTPGEPSPSPTPSVPQDVEVVVLNATTVTGLAGQAANDLEDRGWRVYGVANFRGSVESTAVYFPPGLETEAQQLADSLPGPTRVLPRFGNLSTTRLTVVVSGDYGA